MTLTQGIAWSMFMLGQGGMIIAFCLAVAIPLVPLTIFLYRVYKKEVVFVPPWLWLTYSILTPLAMAVIGTVYYDTRNENAESVAFGLLVLYLIVTIVVLVRSKGRRIFIATLAIFFLIFTTMTALTATMSINNTWL